MNTHSIAQATETVPFDFGTAEPDFATPFCLGVMDAEDGQLCVPEMYFSQPSQMREYARGHESVAGETLLSCSILGKPYRVVDVDEEHIDYVEDMLDRDYWRMGQW